MTVFMLYPNLCYKSVLDSLRPNQQFFSHVGTGLSGL